MYIDNLDEMTFIKLRASEVRPGAFVMWETKNTRLVRFVRDIDAAGSRVALQWAEAGAPGVYNADTILWVAQRAQPQDGWLTGAALDQLLDEVLGPL